MPREIYGYLADFTVGIHLGYCAYVVIGQLLIWAGLLLGWRWIRNPWFRVTHLLAIGIVVLEEIYEYRCPLTVWEEQLRELAGQATTGETFLGRMMHDLLFIEGQPPEFFTWLYGIVGGLVLLTFIAAPPRWPRWRSKQSTVTPLK